MSRYKDQPRLLAYEDAEYDDDDYHTSRKPQISNRSKDYDDLTSKLQTGNKEYGYFQDGAGLESPKYARSHRRIEQSKGPPLMNISRDYDSSREKTPFYGRRGLISESREKAEERLGGKSPPISRRASPGPKLPRVSHGSLAGDSDYGAYRRASREPVRKTRETLKASDIKRIDLVLTLNDETTIEVKAVPFKPHLG